MCCLGQLQMRSGIIVIPVGSFPLLEAKNRVRSLLAAVTTSAPLIAQITRSRTPNKVLRNCPPSLVNLCTIPADIVREVSFVIRHTLNDARKWEPGNGDNAVAGTMLFIGGKNK